MYYIIYMSTIKLSDIMKNNQIGGADNLNLDKNVAPKLEGITTSQDLNFLIFMVRSTSIEPKSNVELTLASGDKNVKVKFHSFYGNNRPFKALQFKIPDGELKTQLTNSPKTRFKVSFDEEEEYKKVTENRTKETTLEVGKKYGFVGSRTLGILTKIKYSGQVASNLTAQGVKQLEEMTEKTLSNEEKAALKAKELQDSIKPTLLKKLVLENLKKEMYYGLMQ